MTNKIRVLIVEDEPAIAEHIAAYLDNNDFSVSGIAYDNADALEELRVNTPDVVILDINLSEEKDGIDIAALINEKYQLPFLFLTAHSDKQTLNRAKSVNPSGYIVKPFNERTLQASVEIAITNHADRVNRQMPKLLPHKVNHGLPEPLSDREFDVLKLVYEGATNKQIAGQLFISENTIKTHLKNIYLKLDANTRYGVLVKLRELMNVT
jgi:DNA-binding NarL/FixJ family response regulator